MLKVVKDGNFHGITIRKHIHCILGRSNKAAICCSKVSNEESK